MDREMFKPWGNDVKMYNLNGSKTSQTAPRGIYATFMGYNKTNGKGFRLIKRDGKIIKFRDAKFFETFESNVALIATPSNDVYVTEPKTYAGAISSGDAIFWKDAYRKKLSLLQDMSVWDIVDRPINQKVIKSRVKFKKKLNADDTADTYKAGIVACEFSQVDRVDFTKTYAPVATFETIRTLVANAINDSK